MPLNFKYILRFFSQCNCLFRRRPIKGALSLLALPTLCVIIIVFHVIINDFERQAKQQVHYQWHEGIRDDPAVQSAANTKTEHNIRESANTENSINVTDSIAHDAFDNLEGSNLDQRDSKQRAEATLEEEDDEDTTDTKYFQHDRTIKEVNCKFIIEGNKTEIEKASYFANFTRPKSLLDRDFITMTRNCSSFIQQRGYIMSSLTQEEANFPIAYSILMYTDVEQTERLLRTIYRPQNVYCIHVDKKSSTSIYNAMQAITFCFDNVFMSAERVNVTWGYFSVLEPDLHCMEELLQRNKTWKYFINLTGQEFPLRTNYELVKILMTYDGANDIEGTIKRSNPERWQGLPPPPHHIKAFKGNMHIAASRHFVEYALHNETAKDLLGWIKGVAVPDECYFSTLNHNPSLKIKGSYLGYPESGNHTADLAKPYLSRFVNWYPDWHHINSWPCHGKWIRMVCIFGPGDLQLLASVPHLFANKFYWDYERYARDCMEELIFNRTRDEYLGKMDFDVGYYKGLGFVKNKVD